MNQKNLHMIDQKIDLDSKKENDHNELICTGVSKNFPGVQALNKLDFKGTLGEIHAILGENGAGKSTFIKILSGVFKPDAGEINFLGKPLFINSPIQSRSYRISVAYQELSLIPDLTVSENIWLQIAKPNRFGMLAKDELRERTNELYKRLDAPFIDPDKKIKQLSFAERQVVEIVKSLAFDPYLLILDEPTSSLPETETIWALNLAKKIADKGSLVLFISHRLEETRQVANKVTILRRGEAVLNGLLNELSDAQIVEAVLGRKPKQLYPPSRSNPTDKKVLSVRNLSIANHLTNVNFDLREGEILGLGGLQGQGQSEVLLALFGIIPYKGEIRVNDQLINIRSPKDAFHAGIGLALIPEDRRRQGLLLSKTLSQNISLPILSKLTRWLLISRQAEIEIVDKMVKRLNINSRDINQTVITLSGGNQQKVVVAKLLSIGTKILLFHDLTRGIDVGTKSEIFELTRDLVATGHSIIMYSSENHELVNMADRILVLRSGKTAAILEGDQRNEESILNAAFGI